MNKNRPINLPLSQVISVNAKSPVAIASILHRISGVLLFLLVPVMLWILQTSLQSPEGFHHVFHDIFGNFAIRFIVWVFVAALAFHFVMGVKHLAADNGIGEELQSGRTTAVVSFVIAAVLIVASFIWIMF